MPRHIASKTEYPDNWDEIAEARKKAVGNKCERCDVPDSKTPKDGNCLTVHHLDGNKQNNAWWNLAATCQRCHLYCQQVIVMDQLLFEFVKVSDWFKPHLEGYKKHKAEQKRAS